ncbi:DUF2953 domain-containing protein [Oceanobacillus bengalensis]|uniref:DUF2953 domain-containing protein n=1 Tax=Oceanobacillus bengalensis TaxID=1435466 RepID=A0A494YWV5_9BACI|nr:DUF2953 domain-containing protein [Oceanobacillus bengalensis]RKQ14634.1 DUF2953 domain-containing protein [Oceanobacillus bengalensis]
MLILIIIVLCFFLLSLFLKIYISIHYSFTNQEQELNVSIKILHIQLSRSIDLSDREEEIPFTQKFDVSSITTKLDNFHTNFKKGNKAITTLLNRTKLHQLDWSTNIGTGEASSTGIISGVIWAIKGSILGYIIEKIRLGCQPAVRVNPFFQQACFQTNIDCMFSIRLGQAIHGILKVIRLLK